MPPVKAPISLPNELVDGDGEDLVEAQLQARRADFVQGISRYLIWVSVIVSITLAILWLLNRSYPQILILAGLTMAMAVSTWLYKVLQLHNRIGAGLFLLSIVSLVAVTLSPILMPSLLPVVGITDVIGIMVLIMLLGDRGSRWWVGGFALAYLVDMVVVGILEWSPFPPLKNNVELWVTGAVSVGVIFTAVLIIRLIVLGLEQQFSLVQRLNLELESQVRMVIDVQETLKQERNLLRQLIDTMPANVYIKDTESRFVEANLETALQMGAKTPNDLIGKTDFEFFTPELAGKYFADEQSLFQTGEALHNGEEQVFDHRTQQEQAFLTTKVPILDERGEITGLVGVGLNITERRHAQEQVMQERNVLRTLIDHIPDYIFVKDANGLFVHSNAAHNEAAQVADADELRGKSALEVFPGYLAVQFEADDQAVLQTGQALINIERTSMDERGEERTVLTTKVPLRDTSGAVTGLVGISRDITEHKQAEAQAFALAGEQQRVRLLREFITDVSHDLRTPLTIIGTSAALVARTTDPARLIRYSERIEDQISRLSLLLDEFVELAHLEQQASSLQYQPTDLASLMQTVIEKIQPDITAAQQHLEYRCEAHPAQVLGDATALTKAITNVVTNAMQFTPAEGTITLRLSCEDENAVIEVADTGSGIPAADLPHIFESFYRGDSARSMESGGGGLGLSITKRIVELMQGRIEVESEVGKGSVFRIYLPVSH